MQIEQIKTIELLNHTKSITKTANYLYLSPAALSKQIYTIEEELGFEIFNRSNKGITPTKKGEIFIKGAISIYNQWSSLLNDINNF